MVVQSLFLINDFIKQRPELSKKVAWYTFLVTTPTGPGIYSLKFSPKNTQRYKLYVKIKNAFDSAFDKYAYGEHPTEVDKEVARELENKLKRRVD